MNRKKSILFVCLGNICRSPIADGVMRDYVEQNNLDIEIDSAGTGDWHVGEHPHEKSIKASIENGIDISMLKSRQITKDDFKNFDMIVGFDDKNIKNLKELDISSSHKIFKIGDFILNGEDVIDPYFNDKYEDFKHVYDMIEKSIPPLVEKLKTF